MNFTTSFDMEVQKLFKKYFVTYKNALLTVTIQYYSTPSEFEYREQAYTCIYGTCFIIRK